jgi:hypothetical protein
MNQKGYFWQGLANGIEKVYGYNQNERMQEQAQESKADIENEKLGLLKQQGDIAAEKAKRDTERQKHLDDMAGLDARVKPIADAYKQNNEAIYKLTIASASSLDPATKAQIASQIEEKRAQNANLEVQAFKFGNVALGKNPNPTLKPAPTVDPMMKAFEILKGAGGKSAIVTPGK